MLFLLLACTPKTHLNAPEAQPLDVVIIPGCPTEADGTLSKCLLQRAVWGAKLWEDGATEAFITSGSSVYNRYIEAEALKVGLVELGVPADRIYTETQALHTDENVGYSLDIVETLGFEKIGMATHGPQAVGMAAMSKGWGHESATFKMDMDWVNAQDWPEVKATPVPEDEWLPLKEREKLIAERRGHARRPHSFFVYTWNGIKGWFNLSRAPVPPVPEPTLDGRRHRVDTRPWMTDVRQAVMVERR